VRRGARIAAYSALGLSGALALGGTLAWWKRCELAEWFALRELAARGAPAQLRVVRLDLRGAEVADVKLGAAPDFALEHGALAWSRESIRERRVDAISLRGVRLRARVDATGARLGALDRLLASLPEGAEGEPLALPFLEARLEDAKAVIESPQGTLHVRASGSAQPEGEVVRAELSLHGDSPQGAIDFGGGATYGLASQEIAATGALGGVTPWGRADGLVRVLGTLAEMGVEFSGTVIPAESTGLRASDPISVRGAGTRDAAGVIAGEAALSAKGIAWEGTLLASEVEIAAKLDGDAGEATASLRMLELPGLARAANAEVRATFASDASRGEADIALREIALTELLRAPEARVKAKLAADGAITARIEAPRALAPDLARLDGVAADARWAEEKLLAEVSVARLVELSQPALIAPLRVEASVAGPRGRLAVRGRALTPGDGLAFEFSGALEPARERLELRIALAETDLASKTRQPQRVFPWLEGVVTGAAGRLAGEALASYDEGVLGASALIALNGLELRTVHGTLRGLMGVISVTEPDPLVTPPGQLLFMSAADVGVPLAAGTVRFELRRDGVLHIEHGEWELAGGKITLEGDVDLEAEEQRAELKASGVKLEKLLEALDFDGLGGTGLLEGTIPVRVSGEHARIENGVLRATGDGVVRFTSGAGADALAKKQPAISPVLGALTDLHYDELTLTLNGDVADRLDVKIRVKGRNPNYQKGRPVVLNVNVDLPASLLQAMMQTAELTGTTAPESVIEALKALATEKP
jgi:hypothetical protein